MNSPRLPASLLIAGLTWLGLATGCSTTVVTVDSLTRAQTHATSYALQANSPTPNADPLLQEETANYLRTAFASKGLHEAPVGTTPDLVVSFDFGIGAPVVRQKKITDPTYVTDIDPTPDYGSSVPVTDADGQTIHRTDSKPVRPTRRRVGQREIIHSTTLYEKHLRVVAREAAAATTGRPPREIWTLDVVSEGPDDNLRKTLPVLVAAAIDYIGTDSQGKQTLHIKDNAPDVRLVKEGVQELAARP